MKIKLATVAVLVLLLVTMATAALAQVSREGYSNFTSIGATRFVTNSPAATTTLTDGGTLTASGSVMPVSAAGSVTVTLTVLDTDGNTPFAGTWLTIYNTVDQSIIISETATAAMSGNQTLGQYDSIQFIFDGTQWVQVSESNN